MGYLCLTLRFQGLLRTSKIFLGPIVCLSGFYQHSMKSAQDVFNMLGTLIA